MAGRKAAPRETIKKTVQEPAREFWENTEKLNAGEFVTVTAHANGDPVRCLFVGNSLTYYNNKPEMYEHITETATGCDIETETLVYAARKPDEHADAIQAVIRTGGDAKGLTKEEKDHFRKRRLSTNGLYSEKVYEDYAEHVLDADGSVKHYDYIFIQDDRGKKSGHSFTDSYEGAKGIMEALSDENTTVVLEMPNFKVKPDSEKARNLQKQDDAVEEQITDAVNYSDTSDRASV